MEKEQTLGTHPHLKHTNDTSGFMNLLWTSTILYERVYGKKIDFS